MSHRYDGSNVKPGSGYEPIPKGRYLLLIIDAQEGHTKTNGDYKVVVEYRVYTGPFEKRRIKFHNVIFFPPDHPMAGLALHYLRCIGEPYEGEFDVNPDAWLGKLVWGEVAIKGKFNEVKGIEKFTEGETDGPVKHDEPADVAATSEEAPPEEEVPF